MTLRTNPEFANLLNASATSNSAWSTAFKNGLGATRRVRCKIAPAGTAQADVFTVGTEFRNAALTGEMTVEAGVVTKYGRTSDLTVATAADLATGVAVLRIEGNGHWIEGTLGLANSGADFVFPVNPTTTNSIAVMPNLRIKPPPFLPSGIGYAPPALSTDAPGYVVIEDWRDPQNVKEAGRVRFNKRLDNWSFTDTEIAAEMGDIRVTHSTDVVTFGDMEFSAVLFSVNAAVNTEPGRALHQVLVMMKPTAQNWPDYPRFSGYRQGTRTFDAAVSYGLSNTFPEAFKARICKADNAVLALLHMDRDGLPINSPELSDYPTKTKPARPHMNCGQVLFWESHKPKMSRKSKKFFPGMDTRALRHSISKEKASYGGVAPMYWNTGGTHGVQHWFASGKWANAMSMDAVNSDLNVDPYLYEINKANVTDNNYSTPAWAAVHGTPAEDMGSLPFGAARTMGWGYEPGGWCMHDQMTGPGGVRVDRGAWAGPTMIHLTDPTWVHLRDNTPINTMAEHWNKGYFNLAHHYFTDLATLGTLPMDELFAGDFALSRTYYGPNNSYTAGGLAYAVPLFVWGTGKVGSNNARPHGGAYTDANYRMPWNGYGPDYFHNYQTPGDVAIHYNSPAHAYSAKHRYITHLMIGLNSNKPNASATSYFANRKHAWMLKQHTAMWKLASEHPQLGVKRADIENRVITELKQVYDEYYVPMWVENSQDTHMQVLKRFGVPVAYSSNNRWAASSFGLTFYMVGVLVQMKQYGFFNKLWHHNNETQKALLTIIRVLDAASIQWFTQTRGSYMASPLPEAQGVTSGPPFIPIDHTNPTNPELPLNWGDWRDRKWPLQGQEDWIHNSDGTYNGPDSSEQLKACWPKVRLAYFRDVPCEYSWAEVQEAADIVEEFHAEWAQKVYNNQHVEKVSINGLRGKEWHIPPPYALLQNPNPADVEAL